MRFSSMTSNVVSRESVRTAIRDEITKLATTTSEIESNFSKIMRGVQNIDALNLAILSLFGKGKAYSSEWAELHDEFTTLVDISQLSASAVQSTIQGLLATIKGHGEDYKGFKDHLSIFINDLEKFQKEETPVERRFLRLRQNVNAFKLDLKDALASPLMPVVYSRPLLGEIDGNIRKLQDQLASASKMFVSSSGVAGLPQADELVGTWNLVAAALTDVGDPIFQDTISRLYPVQGIWRALRMDAKMLQLELSTSDLDSGSVEARRVAVSRFKDRYDTIWFALRHYTSGIATTGSAKAEPRRVAGNPHQALLGANLGIWGSLFKF